MFITYDAYSKIDRSVDFVFIFWNGDQNFHKDQSFTISMIQDRFDPHSQKWRREIERTEELPLWLDFVWM